MIKEKFEASLVVVNFNGYQITKKCVESIFSNSAGVNYELIIVDNASTDGSGEKLKKLFSKKRNVSIVETKINNFLADAFNKGFKHSKGKIVIFMCNDLIVTRNWLKNLIKAFENKKVGIAGVALLSYKKKNIVDTLGCDLNLLAYGIRIDSGKIFKQKNQFRESFFVSGSVVAIRRSLFLKTGGFDQDYQGNYEDVDLAWRVRLLGFNVVVAEKAVVYHLGSWTVKRYVGDINSSYLCRKNRLTTILKDTGCFYLLLVLPIYFPLQSFIFLKELLLSRSLPLAMTTPKAIWWNLINLKSTLEKRKKIQKNRKISDWQIINKMRFLF